MDWGPIKVVILKVVLKQMTKKAVHCEKAQGDSNIDLCAGGSSAHRVGHPRVACKAIGVRVRDRSLVLMFAISSKHKHSTVNVLVRGAVLLVLTHVAAQGRQVLRLERRPAEFA